MKEEMIRFAFERYSDTCELYKGKDEKKSLGLLLKVNLCDIQFMDSYFDELCACFDYLSEKEVRDTLNLNAYMVTETGRVPLHIGQIISVKEFARYKIYKFGLAAQTGARAFYSVMKGSSLSAIIESHKSKLNELTENGAGDEKTGHLKECITTLETFREIAPQDSPLCMFRRNFMVKVEAYDEEQDSLYIAANDMNQKAFAVMQKNQLLYKALEAETGSAVITQAREALKDAFCRCSMMMPVTDDITDIALRAALDNIRK